MKASMILSLLMVVALVGCTAHGAPRCTGALEPINPLTHTQADGDAHDQ